MQVFSVTVFERSSIESVIFQTADGSEHVMDLKTPLICQTGPKTSAKSGWSCSI